MGGTMSSDTIVFARRASGLVRELNWWDVLLITIAGPAASGMTYYSVKVPGVYPGGNMVLAFFLGGLVWLLPALLFAVLASSFPRSGSLYVAISRSTHPILGFLPMWLYVISCGLTVGFLNYIGLYVIGSALQVAGHIADNTSLVNAGDWIDSNYTRLWVSALMTVGVWLVELGGLARLKWFIRSIIYVPLVLTIITLSLFFFVDGKAAWDGVYGSGVAAKIGELARDKGISGALLSPGKALGDSLLWVFWAYASLEVVSFVGSEVKSPRTSYLRGMGIGFAAVMALYCVNAWGPGLCFGSDFVRDYGWLYYNHPDALKNLLGVTPPAPSIPFYAGVCARSAWFAVLLGIGYFMWYLNTSVVLWLASVRGLFAMAFDRQLPLGLCSVSSSGSPTTATHVTGALALLGCLVGLGDAAGTGSAAVVMALLDYAGLFFIWTVGLAALFLPVTRPDLFETSTFQYRWGSVPVLSVVGGAVLGIGFYMILYVGLEMTRTYSLLLTAAMVTVGLALAAWMYSRNRREGIDPNLIFAQIPPA